MRVYVYICVHMYTQYKNIDLYVYMYTCMYMGQAQTPPNPQHVRTPPPMRRGGP